ncbi:hypothetical protein D3C78_880120 [compost metagenome]
MQRHALVDREQLRARVGQAHGQLLVLAGAQLFIETTDLVEPAPAHQQVGTGQPLRDMQRLRIGTQGAALPGIGVPRRFGRGVQVKADDIGLAAGLEVEQQLEPVLGHLDVGIDKGQPFAAGDRRSAIAQCTDEQAGQDQHLGAELSGNVRALVIGAVVDHDQLAFDVGRLGGMSCRLQGPGDVPGLVVHRDDDADAVHALTSVGGASSALVRSTLVNASMIHRYL